MASLIVRVDSIINIYDHFNVTPVPHVIRREANQLDLPIRCKNLALYIRDCVSLCLSYETLKAVGPFYLVSMPGEVKDPTSLHCKCSAVSVTHPQGPGDVLQIAIEG